MAATAPERLHGFWSTFFGWPDVYRSTLRPFARELPELGLALMAALVWFGVTHRHAPLPDLLNHPGALVLYWMLAMGLFTPVSSTSRYWFPVLPVLYTLIAVSLAEAMTRWLPRAEVAAPYGASLVFFLLFALSPDFQPRHILNVEDDAVRYRTGEFARFASVWYPRLDVATAAETLEDRHADAPGARIVIEELPAFSYYLDAEHAVYFHRDFNRFALLSREEGQLEMWSGQRLLSTPADLVAYAKPGEELWLVRSINPGGRHRIDLTALTASQLTEIERDVLGRDGAIEFIRLRPLPPAKSTSRGPG